MQQLILIVLAVILLLFVIAWYSGLGDVIKDLLNKFGNML